MDVDLVIAAGRPVVQLLLLAGIGVFLAKKGILPPDAQRLLAKLNAIIFVPALLLVRLASSVDLEKILRWWYIPVSMGAFIVVGYGLGVCMTRLARTPAWFKPHARLACATGNVGNLPLVLIPTLAKSKGANLGEGAEDRGVAYLAFGIWVVSIYLWSVADTLLRQASKTESYTRFQGSNSGSQPDCAAPPDGTPPPPAVPPTPCDHHLSAVGSLDGTACSQRNLSNGRGGVSGSIELCIITDPLDDCGTADSHRSQLDGTPPASPSAAPNQSAASPPPDATSPWKRIALNFFTPATNASILGMVLGCIPAMGPLVFDNDDPGPLNFIADVLDTLAGALVPTLLMVLGASLSKGPGAIPVHQPTLWGTVVIRLIVLPIIGLGATLGAIQLGVLDPPDKMFVLVTLLITTMPTALNLANVAALHRTGAEELGVIMFYQYLLAVPVLPIWIVVYLAVLKDMSFGDTD